MKYCGGCEKDRPLAEFYKRRASKDGLSYRCMACVTEYRLSHRVETAEYYKSHRAEILEQKRGYSQTPAGKAAAYRNTKNQHELYPKKMKARSKVKYATKAGRLVRASHCVECKEERFTEGHHPDYSKPLEVDWLCKECHRKLHKILKEI